MYCVNWFSLAPSTGDRQHCLYIGNGQYTQVPPHDPTPVVFGRYHCCIECVMDRPRWESGLPCGLRNVGSSGVGVAMPNSVVTWGQRKPHESLQGAKCLPTKLPSKKCLLRKRLPKKCRPRSACPQSASQKSLPWKRVLTKCLPTTCLPEK